jgi:WD40 repeat protein
VQEASGRCRCQSHAFTISADGRKAAFLAADRVFLCDLSTECEKPERHVIRVPAPRDVALSEDGAVLAVTGAQLALFDTSPWKQRAIREMATLDELAVSVDPDHVNVCTTGNLQQFDAYDDSLDSRPVQQFPSPAWECGFSSRGVFATHFDGTIRVWNAGGGLVSAVSAPLETAVRPALGSRTMVIVATEHFQVWDVKPYGRLDEGGVRGLARGGAYAYGPDRLVELDTGAITPAPDVANRGVAPAALSDSLALAAYYEMTDWGKGEIALVALQPGGASAERWRYGLDALTPREPDRPIGLESVPDLTISRDDRYVAIHAEGSTTIVHAGNGHVVRTLIGKSVFVFAPGDEVLAVDQRGVVAISLKDGSERRLPDFPVSSERAAARAAGDGSGQRRWPCIAVAQVLGPTSVVHVFAWPDLKMVEQLKHTTGIVSLSFRADAEKLMVSTNDGTTHVWDVPSGREVSTIPPPQDETSGNAMAVFTPRGQIAIYTGTGVTVLPNDPGEWRNEACRRLVRNLTADEWAFFVGEDIAYERTCPDRP